jgi:hypothetical protein
LIRRLKIVVPGSPWPKWRQKVMALVVVLMQMEVRFQLKYNE